MESLLRKLIEEKAAVTLIYSDGKEVLGIIDWGVHLTDYALRLPSGKYIQNGKFDFSNIKTIEGTNIYLN